MAKKLYNVNMIIIVCTLIICIVIWFCMPREVAIHFNLAMEATGSGHKIFILPVLLIPLSGFIPFKPEKIEFHNPKLSEEFIKEINDAEETKYAIWRLIVTIVTCIIPIGIYVLILL